MYQLTILFQNPRQSRKEMRLRWSILNHPPAKVWLNLLLQSLKTQRPLYPRMTGFVSPTKDLARINAKLNQCIDIINRSGKYQIQEKAQGGFTQEFSNRIHHHFELLRGPHENPTPLFRNASLELAHAILGLNHGTHDLESLHRSLEAEKTKSRSGRALVLEGLNLPKVPLDLEAYSYFSMQVAFGDLMLHYSQIGKTWWEVFLDQDQDIFPEAIIPLKNITAEFDVFFYQYSPLPQTWHDLKNFLEKNGQDIRDPRLALGYLPVAKLVRDDASTDAQIEASLLTHFEPIELQVHQGSELLGRLPISSDLIRLSSEPPLTELGS